MKRFVLFFLPLILISAQLSHSMEGPKTKPQEPEVPGKTFGVLNRDYVSFDQDFRML
jgi:hypothetical protein